MKRFISILLCSIMLVSCFCLNSFGYTDYIYHPTDFSVTMQNQLAQPNGTITDYSSTVAYTTQTSGGITYYRYYNTNTNYYTSGYTKEIHMIRITDLSITHEYEFSMYTRMFAAVGYSAEFYLVDGNGTILTVLSYDNVSSDLGNSNHLIKFGFTLENLNLSTNADVYLKIVFQVSSWFSYNFQLGISDITLRDLDDDTGFFESIIQWIRNVASNVTTIGSNIVSGLTNLGNNISTWLTSVKDGIVNKLTEVKNGIVDKLTAIKDNIVSAINNIQAWFVSLGDRISDFFTMLKNYLLYFKHPVTLNQDGVPVDSQGNPVYTNPFESVLSDVEETINDWIDSINDFIDSIDESADTVSQPLQLFKDIITRFGNGVPFFTGLILFAVVFFVIRKIVGR